MALESEMLPRLRTCDRPPRHLDDYPSLRYPLAPFNAVHAVPYLLDKTSQRLFFASLPGSTAARKKGRFVLRETMLIQLMNEPFTLFLEGREITMNVKLFWVNDRGKLRNVRLYLATDSKRSLCFHTHNLVKHRRENLEVHRLLAWTFKCPLSYVRWASGCDVDHRYRMHHDNAVENVDVRLTSDHRSEAGRFGGLQSGVVRQRKAAAREQRKAAAKASAKARRDRRTMKIQ